MNSLTVEQCIALHHIAYIYRTKVGGTDVCLVTFMSKFEWKLIQTFGRLESTNTVLYELQQLNKFIVSNQAHATWDIMRYVVQF